MEPNRLARSVEDLRVYQRALVLARHVFEFSCGLPRDERYSLCDQIRRSSRSVGAQVAEAWAKRQYPKHFAAKLTDAAGELSETRHWLRIAKDCGYLSDQQEAVLLDDVDQTGRMLTAMIAKADAFCDRPGTGVHDLTEDYLSSGDVDGETSDEVV